MGWHPIDTAPLHTTILFFREDAGVFSGQKTYCAEWVIEAEQEEENYDEDTLFKIDCWAFEHDGAHRLEGDSTPTHWMPLPSEPSGHVAVVTPSIQALNAAFMMGAIS